MSNEYSPVSEDLIGKEKFISSEGQTEFILTSYDPTKPIMVFLNGLYQEDEDE